MAPVPTYVIDLACDERERWQEVIAQEKATAGLLVQEAAAEFESVPEIARWLFARLYHAFGGLYRGEIRAWADALGLSVGTVTLLNCAYELSHVRVPRLFGCTAGVRWADGLGMVHARTLDWPLPGMSGATRVFRFRRGSREFVAVGVPGQVSVLSGMLPGSHSITVNWAPPAARPSFDFGPAFLVRDTLETCDSYDEAVEALRSTPLSTSAFFTVCGTEQGQACVIERTQRAAIVRGMVETAIAQANHHVAEPFIANNQVLAEIEEEGFHEDSSVRATVMSQVLTDIGAGITIDDALGLLERAPLLNQYTVQRMVFCPRTGEVRVWNAPVTEPASLPREAPQSDG
jgi:hypothetical protein